MTSPALQIIDFMKIVEKLCLVERDVRLTNGRLENDSSHIFKVTFLVMLVFPYLKQKLDYAKMLEMALVHDLVEAKSGDYPLAQLQANPNLKLQKKQNELEAIKYFKTLLPEPLNNKIYDLFLEYENRATLEAKVVYAIDKMEANLQANQYGDGDIRYWADQEGGEWYYKAAVSQLPVIAELDEQILRDVEAAIIELSYKNIQKHNIKFSC